MVILVRLVFVLREEVVDGFGDLQTWVLPLEVKMWRNTLVQLILEVFRIDNQSHIVPFIQQLTGADQKLWMNKK